MAAGAEFVSPIWRSSRSGRGTSGHRRTVHCQGGRPYERAINRIERGSDRRTDPWPRPTTTAEKFAKPRTSGAGQGTRRCAKAAAKRDKKGIPSARARIHELVDPGSFLEIGALAKTPAIPALFGDGVVTGHGTINGRPVGVFSHDQTVFQGTVGEMFGRVARLMEWVAMVGCPSSASTTPRRRPHPGRGDLAGLVRRDSGRRHELLSGTIPQISIILGKCAGGAVYSPIQTDLVVNGARPGLHVCHRTRRHQGRHR